MTDCQIPLALGKEVPPALLQLPPTPALLARRATRSKYEQKTRYVKYCLHSIM